MKLLANLSVRDAIERPRDLDGNLPVLIDSKTSESLVSCGMANLPVLMTPAHVKKALLPLDRGGHGLTREALCGLPDLLSDPVAVFTTPPLIAQDKLMVVLDLIDAKGDPVVAVIAPETRLFDSARALGLKSGDAVNFVLSVYGRCSAFTEMRMAASCGLAALVDRKRVESMEQGVFGRLEKAA